MTTPADMMTMMTQQQSQARSALDEIKHQQTMEKLVSWAKSQYEEMKSSRQANVNQWYLNYAMYSGNQYVDVLNKAGIAQIKVPKAAPHRVRHTVNIIRPMIRTEIARMTSQKPSATVIPATTADEDMFAAQAGEQVLQYIRQRRSFDKMIRRNAFWVAVTGTGFVKTWWDPNQVDKYAINPETGEPAVGDVMISNTTPFNIFVPDLLQEEVEDQPYIFEVYTRGVEWVKKFWGINVVPSVSSKNEIIETSKLGIAGGNSAKPDSVLVMECWVKPGGTELLPDGGMFTIVGDQMIQEPTGFYEHGEYPYAKFEHIPTGKFYADSVLVDVNNLQKEYNRTRSSIIEAKRLMARPQLLYAIGSIDPHRMSNEPGLMIPYRPGLPKPEPIILQPLPSYVLQEQDRIKSDFEDITGQHQVSRGQSPGAGVTAATAISFLQERDDSIMTTVYDSIEEGIEKVSRQILDLVVTYWDEPRTIGVTGLDQSFDVAELKGSEIARGRNVRIEGGSALPQSKPARQAWLMDMFDRGIISGDQLLDLFDIGGLNKLTERIRTDLRQAQRENIKMKRITEESLTEYYTQMFESFSEGIDGTFDPESGMPTMDPGIIATYPPMIPVNDFDNHAVHIATHNNFRKSQQFEMVPDFVKMEFAKHINLHQEALQAQQMQEMQMGMEGMDQSAQQLPSMPGDSQMPEPMTGEPGDEQQ